ncbi:LysR family transcriptional regulator [Streptomyces sp. SID13031]|uniref:LysR family transcriptional regulator n=1 Tax=Streptomyces sp. SID13031 TaxID=2706046 RepID=UPI0013CB88A7|nr:LysR family transcriptional regulator [Streptomyces sp. SID13031]NEA31817.1 LysR family transcriptional regulator [Streptomyces sp. SID13031]
MDLRLLRAFVTLARCGSFGSAAAELATSQPALTKQIQQLERRLASTLFDRGRHGARLTAAGELLLPDALDVLARVEGFERRAAQIALGVEGSLTVGFGMSGIELAPRAVALFRSRYPQVQVTLGDLSSAVQYERLLAGSLQVGLVRLPAPPGLKHLRLQKDRLSLAVPVGQAVPAGLAAWLDGRPLVRLLPERGPGLTAQLTALYAELGCRPLILQEAADLQTVLALVAAGVGPAVVPATSASIASAAVRFIPFPGEAATWWTGAAWNPAFPSPLVSHFLTAASQVADRA